MSNETTTPEYDTEGIAKIADMIKDIRIAMLTTVGTDGHLSSRPMAAQEAHFDGESWFFSMDDTEKVRDIQRNEQVAIAYSDAEHQHYVSLSGVAEISHDKAKMAGLWKPQLKAWFPDELATPGICLIRVRVQHAELWDSPSTPVAHLIGLVKSTLTGKQQDVGDHRSVEVRSNV